MKVSGFEDTVRFNAGVHRVTAGEEVLSILTVLAGTV